MVQDTSVLIQIIPITILEATRIIIPTGPQLIRAVKVSATDSINQVHRRTNFLSPDHGPQVEDSAIEAEEDLEEERKTEEEEEQLMPEYSRLQAKTNETPLPSLRLRTVSKLILQILEGIPDLRILMKQLLRKSNKRPSTSLMIKISRSKNSINMTTIKMKIIIMKSIIIIIMK